MTAGAGAGASMGAGRLLLVLANGAASARREAGVAGRGAVAGDSSEITAG
jgi:hypothetical protein